MAILSRKITTYTQNVKDLADTPALTATQLKAFFDGRGDNEIKDSINGIVDDLSATTDGASGADQIGATPVKDGGAETVQGVLEEIKADASADLTTHMNDTANPHSVTKSQVGLGNADNTADVNKAVLSATKLATARKIGDADFDGSANISASDIGVYTKQQAVQKFAYLEEAEGNSVQIVDTVEAPFGSLEVLGETVATPTDPLQDVSTDNPQTLDSLGGFDYKINGKNLLIYPFSHTTKTQDGITFTDNGDGSVTVNGTATVNAFFELKSTGVAPYIQVKPNTSYTLSGNPDGANMTLYLYVLDEFFLTLGDYYDTGSGVTFLTSSDAKYLTVIFFVKKDKVVSNLTLYPQVEVGSSATNYEPYQGITKTISLKDTTDTQLYLASYLTDCDKIVKKSDGKWYHRQYIDFKVDATTRSDYADILDPPVDTELCTADQTALNEIEAQGTFDGTTNIMLSTEAGEVSVEGAKDITKVISDMASAIALLG